MGTISFLLLIFAVSTASATPSPYQKLPADLPCRYGSIGIRPFALTPDTVAVARVFLHSPADRAGLLPGDRLIAVSPYLVRTPDELSRCIQSFPPGSPLKIEIQRRQRRLTLSCTTTDVRRLYFLMGEQGIRPGTTAAPRHQRWSAQADALEKASLHLISRAGVHAERSAFFGAMAAELDRYAGDCRLRDIHYALLHPLKGSQIARDLAEEFSSPATLETYLTAAAVHLDLNLSPLSISAEIIPPALLDPDNPLLSRLLLAPFFASDYRVGDAFASLTPAERHRLEAGILPLLDRFGRSFYLDEGEPAETAAHIATLRLAKKVDLARLFAGAILLARSVNPETLAQIHRIARRLEPSRVQLPPTLSGDFLYARPTPAGWILIGDKGPNFYGENAAIILDLGGDDIYADNLAAPLPLPAESPPGSRVSLIVDYGGDDIHFGPAGAGRGGIGLLIDLEGDDLYQGNLLSQGAAFCGIGVLWDRRGNDIYLARENVQGTGFFGAGLLIDEEGSDLYIASQFAQGFGGSRGLGLLLDSRGNDRYLADQKILSTYGTEGFYRGWAQGVGCGFRGFSSGGLGLLIDAAGDDDYQAGDFSQGTGYFFGLGALIDAAGDDEYRGSRYAQGSGAHQAIGVLVDENGNDVYRAKSAASQGAAWDAAIGLLEDRKGDDTYSGRELSQGAGAMNGLGLLLDWRGKDRYRALTGQGQAGSAAYWRGRGAGNLGLLIDVGGQTDEYDQIDRADGVLVKTPGVGLFLDR
jgi:hypothetical protein